MTDRKPLYTGEAILLNWTDTKSGRKIVLQLEKDGPGAHPFDGLDGERFAVVIVGPLATAEHEIPSPQDKRGIRAGGGAGRNGDPGSPTTPTRFKQRWSDLRPSARAALMTNDAEFWRYLGTCGVTEPTTAMAADTSLKFLCNIQSKRELDERGKATAAFERLCGNFQAWRQAKQHGAIP